MSEEDGVEAPNALVGDRYRLVRLVGRGGMGAVWEGYDERLRRRVALKVLHVPQGLPDGEADQLAGRAMREAQLVARLEHHNAVSIYDVVQYQGQPCLVMEFVPSRTLAESLREVTVLRERGAATIGAEVASALTAAHAAGIVHRDVKPANILIAEDGTARISDFGIAHALGGDTTLTSTGMITGTPAYLAPEVARGGESGYASDVYSLGATLYAALEGQPPFGSEPNPMRLLHKVASGRFTPPQHAGALTPLLTQMLAADPHDRPPMAQVAQELTQFAATGHTASAPPEATRTLPVTPQDAPVPPALPPPVEPVDEGPLPVGRPVEGAPPRRRGLLAAIVALLVLALVVAAFVLLRPSDQGTPTVQPTSSASVSSAPSSRPSTSTAPTSTAPTSSPAPSTSTTLPTTPPPTSSSASSTTTVPATPTAEQLAAAISSYYTLVPGKLDEAWALLTPDYQARTAGGRSSFGTFWSTYSSVTATEVKGSPPSTVTALITYTAKDGKVSKEQTTFGLVNDNGVLKINSSTVNSSS